jgi:hypothetical protein
MKLHQKLETKLAPKAWSLHGCYCGFSESCPKENNQQRKKGAKLFSR